MKFKRFYRLSDWSWFFLIPEVIFRSDEPNYCPKHTFRVSIHWLGWHISWLWIKEDEV